MSVKIEHLTPGLARAIAEALEIIPNEGVAGKVGFETLRRWADEQEKPQTKKVRVEFDWPVDKPTSSLIGPFLKVLPSGWTIIKDERLDENA